MNSCKANSSSALYSRKARFAISFNRSRHGFLSNVQARGSALLFQKRIFFEGLECLASAFSIAEVFSLS
jgi:hypothetical protein